MDEDVYNAIKDEIRRGGFPSMCGCTLTTGQVKEIHDLLFPFNSDRWNYYKHVVLTRLEWQRK